VDAWVGFARLGLLTDAGDGRRWVVRGLIFTAGAFTAHVHLAGPADAQ
jgi:hypothetical protein